ncbi:MAG: SpoIIE family protein phosphatase [Spirochaetes bacterium]|jgi:serine phosphatase RsbU (regulator of sigma subunit)|nr:SpoIIE family protein phosphatase [Spirochaetota bacterium]
MENFLNHMSIFIIPPLLCLIIGVGLAVISVFKGRLKIENILFSLVCIWWCLLSPIFISHHLTDDVNLIMKIERGFHFFYVFLPAVNIIFYHKILNIKRRYIEIIILVFSAAMAVATRTDYYIYGLNRFGWGYMAKGGAALLIFGFVSFLTLLYGIYICVRKLRTEKNYLEQLKIKYVLFSLNISGVLTLFNIPSMNGYDFYPLGNFMFVPLIIMSYGVLRYKLLDIRSILHLTLIWIVISSLFIIPNIILFIFARPYLAVVEPRLLFIFFSLWFLLNYIYLQRIQPLINELFNRQKYNLRRMESEFITEISYLKNLKELIAEFMDILKRGLALKWVDFYLASGETGDFENMNGDLIRLDGEIQEWFVGANHLAEMNMVERNPYYSAIRDKLMGIFNEYSCAYIVPLVQNETLIGILLLGDKSNLKYLIADEITFINNIRTAAAISLSNSVMYQNISNLKDNLELIVEERTGELAKKNEQMLFELKVAKNVQKTILPAELPFDESLKIVARIKPLMEVSGDFYDVIRLPGGRVGISMVDVSGHGIPSALLASMIKAEIDTQIKAHEDTAEICARINANLRGVLSETGFYFTLFLCIIDTSDMTMVYTNCGHTNPLIFQPDGSIRKLSTGGFFIGTPLEATYESKRIRLGDGDRIFIFTDGITDARNSAGVLFGEDRFIKSIKSSMQAEVKSQLAEIFEDISLYGTGSESLKKDDATLMIIEIGRPDSITMRIRDAVRLYRDKNFSGALEVLSGIEEGDLNGVHFFILAKMQLAVNEPGPALKNADLAVRNEPDNISFIYLQGKIRLKLGDSRGALECFKRVYKSDPAFKKVSYYLGRLGG